MRNAFIIIKKELRRVFTDKRLIFTIIILPGLAIYLMYSFIGNAIGNTIEDVEEHTMSIYTEHMPLVLQEAIKDTESDVIFTDAKSVPLSLLKEKIKAGDIDLYIAFPPDFTERITAYEDAATTIPTVTIIYNNGERYSESTYYKVQTALNNYASSINYDRFGDAMYPFMQETTISVDEDKASGQQIAGLLPLLIIMFLFTGAMSIGPDSIAGEKERGTIATLLVTPINRSDLAIGKVLSLSIISLLSAISSFTGILLSLPKLLNQEDTLTANIYQLQDYFLIFITLLATTFVIVGMISMVSAFAKTIKEASMLILPFYFLSIITAMSTMFAPEPASDLVLYLIPIYNTINVLIRILTFDVASIHVILLVVSSLGYTGILIYIINKLFSSEKIMFSK
ncbi:MAG: ABC transporter permease [Candidatus Izimaplasma sp.]|nr:ABC transporter permease [Candidatus Izimaplasma bacterium]